MSVQRIKNLQGNDLAYVLSEGKDPSLPMVVFLGGFRSDMEGTKALFLEQSCQKRGQSFLRFDYSGHGASGGAFKDGTIGQWTQDALFILDEVSSGPLILVGSSMGGWISLLCARKRSERVRGFIGLAAAPDFTKEIYYDLFSDEYRSIIDSQGYIEVPNDYSDEPYYISKALIEDGKTHCLLDKPIPITVPVRLIQGMDDKDVPWQKAFRIKQALDSKDVEVFLIEDAGHSLSRESDLKILNSLVVELSTGKKETLPDFSAASVKLKE